MFCPRHRGFYQPAYVFVVSVGTYTIPMHPMGKDVSCFFFLGGGQLKHVQVGGSPSTKRNPISFFC